MGGWRRYLELQAKAKTGLSSALVTWAFLAVVCGAVTFGFTLVTAFVWLADSYGPLPAALALGGFFLLVTIIALVGGVWSHRRTITRAELALAARRNAPLLDPRLLPAALQLGRAIGARKLVPLIAIGILVVGVGMQWYGRHESVGEGRRAMAA
jgi:hypothetical protein